MRQCENITCWTDYPFVELGDIPFTKAPIRHVLVLDYDGDKYATVEILSCGVVSSIKAVYLYSGRGRLGQVKQVSRRKLERMK